MTEKTLYIAWQDPAGRSWYPVARVRFEPPDRYVFEYIQGARRANESPGFPGIAQFSDLHVRYTADDLFPFLKNRVIPPTRGDYQQYTDRLGLSDEGIFHSIHAFELLERSNGRRATDRFEVFAGPEVEGDQATFVFFLRGMRYLNELTREAWEEREPDLPLRVFLEPSNPYDPDAVLVTAQTLLPMGFVPRYYSSSIARLVRSGSTPELSIVRQNQPPAPARERFLVKMTLQVPSEWEFAHDDDYRVVAANEEVAA